MTGMTEAYITGIGAYLPGGPVCNSELAARLGDGTRRGTALGRQALMANGIRTRHYATDEQGRTVLLNEELAAHAARRALADRGLPVSSVRMLATGTTQGDVLVPGFASMVHGRLGGGPMELLSAAGVCASSMAALKAAVSAVRLGEHPVAVAVGSELASRSLAARGPRANPASASAAHSGIADQAPAPADPDDSAPDVTFLRWTLSDGAGAVVVEPEPRPGGLSLRVDWMHLVSHAHDHPVCMSAGLGEDRDPRPGNTWLDRRDPTPCTEGTASTTRTAATRAAATGAAGTGAAGTGAIPRLRQDMSALPALVDMGVAEYTALVEAGRIDPATEHILCHYSAEHFREKLLARLREAGHAPDEDRWFTNLHTAGNTGAASIFVMLDAARPRLRPGDRVLLVVPESGRFTLAFAQLTCVGTDQDHARNGGAGRAAATGRARPSWPPRRSARPIPPPRPPSAGRWPSWPACGPSSSGRWPGCPSCAGSRTARPPSPTTAACCSTCASRWWTAAGGSRSPRRASRPSCSGYAAPRSSTPPRSTATIRCWSATSPRPAGILP